MRNRYCPAAAVVLAVAGVASAQTSQFKISIGVRETGSTAAIGADGGGAGSIEWVDQDIQGLNADGQWHKFTFNFGTDPVSSFTGDGVLSTANMRGVLEHIRILNSGQTTNPITFWLDDLVNTVSGVDNVLGTWDSSQVAPGGYYLFRDPYWSGSTQTFVKPGATAKADATDFHSGDGSYKIDWSFVNPNPAGWVRMTTVGANPTIDFSNGNSVSFWLKAALGTPTQFWSNNGDGNWTDPANWAGGTVPNSANGVANFLSAITTPHTVTLDQSVTVNTVTIDNAIPYTIGHAGDTNVLNLGGAAGYNANITVSSGSHTIAAPVAVTTVSMPLVVFVTSAASTLTFTDEITTNGNAVIKQGDGTMAVKDLRNTALTVSAGTVRVAPNGTDAGVSKVTALSIAGGATPTATLDLTNNKLVIDYTGTSPAPTVRSQLHAARNNGTWDGHGIASSTAGADGQKRTAIGWAEASDLLGLADPNTATWAGQTVDGSSILLKYTYYGDANLDGRVDGDDYTMIDRYVAANGLGTTTSARWIDGDFDYSGTVDAADYFLIDRVFAQQGGVLSPEFLAGRASQFGGAYVAELLAAVPEPASVGTLGLLGFGLVGRRARRR